MAIMNNLSFSVVIPAHNEEKYVERCIHSIRKSAEYYGKEAEIIVVCNRCTDKTEEIALTNGAKVIHNQDKCIAKTRNAGIGVATGDVVVTIDCDNRMTEGTISEIALLLSTGKYIGGGAPMRFERYSLPLFFNDMMCRVSFALTGLYCGIFWAEKSTFDAVGGFEEIKAMEDVATAKKIKKYGKQQGKKYTTLRKNYLINSTRKFDDMGDWLYFKLIFTNLGSFFKAAKGDKTDLDHLLDDLFYNYNDKK